VGRERKRWRWELCAPATRAQPHVTPSSQCTFHSNIGLVHILGSRHKALQRGRVPGAPPAREAQADSVRRCTRASSGKIATLRTLRLPSRSGQQWSSCCGPSAEGTVECNMPLKAWREAKQDARVPKGMGSTMRKSSAAGSAFGLIRAAGNATKRRVRTRQTRRGEGREKRDGGEHGPM
jgi:hypothetical protein